MRRTVFSALWIAASTAVCAWARWLSTITLGWPASTIGAHRVRHGRAADGDLDQTMGLHALGDRRDLRGEVVHAGTVFAYLIFVIAAQSLVLAPIIISAVAPKPSARLLDAAQRWLDRNSPVITIVASLSFGAWFLIKGTTGITHP
jgi:hypothetical protein